MEELIDVLDDFGNKTGQIKPKSEIKRDGDWHRAISVLILNDDKILAQRRSAAKKFYPNLWSIFVKGHVQSGEETLDACVREIKEELGINIDKSQLKFLYTLKEDKRINDYIERIFYDTYILRKNVDLKDVTIQQEELSEVKYMDVKEVYGLIKNGSKEFVPNDEDYKRIFDFIKL